MSADFYIFGGTFDPIHEGHVGVLRELSAKNVVIAPTEINPFKNQPSQSLAKRIKMIERVLDYEKIEHSMLDPKLSPEKGLYISDFKYSYVCDFVTWWQSNFSGEIFWVIGPDLLEQVKTWKNWDIMNLKVYVCKSYANGLHSTDVRELKHPMHPALR